MTSACRREPLIDSEDDDDRFPSCSPVTDNSIAKYYYYFIYKLIRSLAYIVRILISSKWDDKRGISIDRRVCGTNSDDLLAACVHCSRSTVIIAPEVRGGRLIK